MGLNLKFIVHSFIWSYFLFLPLRLPAEVVRKFEYNKNNQLVKEEKANDHRISYEYDPCGRLSKKTTSNGAKVVFDYDKNGNCTQMSDANGTTSYSYDHLNRLVAVQYPIGDQIYYSYDPRGRLTAITYPNGWKVSSGYDSASRLVSVTDPNGTTKYDYDNSTNTLVKVILPNGVVTEYNYNQMKRITDAKHTRSDGSSLKSYHYSYDANGNRTTIREVSTSGSREIVCKYDKLNRLISVEYPDGFEKFTYDGAGNRLSRETTIGATHYQYDQCNRLVKAGDTQFFYDSSGNLTKKISLEGTAEYTYDDEDNLVEYRNSAHIVQYGYDGEGRRVSKCVDGETTYYVNDINSPLAQVLLKITASKKPVLYTYGLSRLSEVLPSGIEFYLYDHPDRSVVALVDKDRVLAVSVRDILLCIGDTLGLSKKESSICTNYNKTLYSQLPTNL